MDVRRGTMLRPTRSSSPDLDKIILEDCDAAVATGIRRWASELTPRHSITSRRYSMTAGLRRYVDSEVERVLDDFRPAVERNIAWLDGFKVSQAWRHNSTRRDDHHATPFSQAAASSQIWTDRIKGAILGLDFGAYSAQTLVFEQSALIVPTRAPGQVTLYLHVEFRRLFHTLRTIERLIYWCTEQRPESETDYSSNVNRIRSYPTRAFCALCWRSPEHETARAAKARSPRGRLDAVWDTPEWQQRFAESDRHEAEIALVAASLPHRPSRKLCHLHRRGSKLYSSDAKYSQQFREEIFYLQNRPHVDAALIAWDKDPTSDWGMRVVVVPETTDPGAIRRAAYAKVHSGLQGLRAQVAYMYAKGNTLPEIARISGRPLRTVQYNFGRIVADLEYLMSTSRSDGTEYPYRKPIRTPLDEAAALDLLRESVRLE